MKKKIFCFDIDNTICKTSKSNYSKSIPNKKAIKLINSLYLKGHTIKILTARYMGRNNDDLKKANKQGYKKTFAQLKKWNLKFHKLFISKPNYDIFIDDKSLNFNKKWISEIQKKYLRH
jgi:hypothetical protein